MKNAELTFLAKQMYGPCLRKFSCFFTLTGISERFVCIVSWYLRNRSCPPPQLSRRLASPRSLAVNCWENVLPMEPDMARSIGLAEIDSLCSRRFGNSGTNVQLILMGSSPQFKDGELSGKMPVERPQVKIMGWLQVSCFWRQETYFYEALMHTCIPAYLLAFKSILCNIFFAAGRVADRLGMHFAHSSCILGFTRIEH